MRVRPYAYAVSCLLMFLVAFHAHHSAFGQPSLFDRSFLPMMAEYDSVNGIVLQSDGKIIIGGYFESTAGGTNRYLMRLHSNGQLDESFSDGTDETVWKLVQQPDGKILVTGSFSNLQGVARPGIGRLLANGDIDPTFEPPGDLATNQFFALALQSDGKVLVGGSWSDIGPSGSSNRVFRLTANGEVDGSFVHTNAFYAFLIHSLLQRSDGSIFVGGGFSNVNGSELIGLARLDSTGKLDTNFNLHMQWGSDILGIAEQSNKVFLAGVLKPEASTNSLVVARLHSNLQWDSSFVADDFAWAPPFAYLGSILVQPDGKIVVGGNFHGVGGYGRVNLARLDSTGHVDPCFDSGIGFVGGFGQPVFALARYPDGRILAGGDFHGGLIGHPGKLARLFPQSACGAIRIEFSKSGGGQSAVVATFPPGGTNYLQLSTNLINWESVAGDTWPIIFFPHDDPALLGDGQGLFFRAKKEL